MLFPDIFPTSHQNNWPNATSQCHSPLLLPPLNCSSFTPTPLHSMTSPGSFLFGLLLPALLCPQTGHSSPLDGPNVQGMATFELTSANEPLGAVRRERRATRRLSSASAEGGYLYRNRYYVSRWHRRRFVPSESSREGQPTNAQSESQRVCGIYLASRTRQLCGDCAPANMRRVELLEKKADKSAGTAERRLTLTQMCCEKRCTDDQIREYCCRAQNS